MAWWLRRQAERASRRHRDAKSVGRCPCARGDGPIARRVDVVNVARFGYVWPSAELAILAQVIDLVGSPTWARTRDLRINRRIQPLSLSGCDARTRENWSRRDPRGAQRSAAWLRFGYVRFRRVDRMTERHMGTTSAERSNEVVQPNRSQLRRCLPEAGAACGQLRPFTNVRFAEV